MPWHTGQIWSDPVFWWRLLKWIPSAKKGRWEILSIVVYEGSGGDDSSIPLINWCLAQVSHFPFLLRKRINKERKPEILNTLLNRLLSRILDTCYLSSTRDPSEMIGFGLLTFTFIWADSAFRNASPFQQGWRIQHESDSLCRCSILFICGWNHRAPGFWLLSD